MKSIINLLFLSIFTVYNINVHAQSGKCKFDVEKKDTFSGKEYKSVKVNLMATHEKANHKYTFEFVKNDTIYYMIISRNFTGRLVEMIPQGEDILFKLNGGAIMYLSVLDETTPTLNSTGLSVSSTYNLPLKLTKDLLEKLSSKTISSLKFAIGKLYIQDELSKEEAEKITSVCICLLK
jgi:hypothetical protein